MVRSMTGFGRGESNDGIRKFIVEIKSLNHRYNDIIIKMPKHLNYIEENIKKIVRSEVNRGRVEVFINLEYISDADINVKVDLPLAQSYKNALDKLSNQLEIDNTITLVLKLYLFLLF